MLSQFGTGLALDVDVNQKAGLHAILSTWPQLGNPSVLGSNAWNLSGPVQSSFYGLLLSSSSGTAYTTVVGLNIDALWGPEVIPLPTMSGFFNASASPALSQISIINNNISYAAQSALYLPTIQSITVQNSSMVAFGNTSSLSQLAALFINNCDSLVSIPTFTNSSSLNYINIRNAISLTNFTSLPTLLSGKVSSLLISNTSLQTLPFGWGIYSHVYFMNNALVLTLPPVTTCTTTLLNITNHAIQVDLPDLRACPLTSFTLDSNPKLQVPNSNVSGTFLNYVYLNEVVVLGLQPPSWLCTSTASTVSWVLRAISLTSLPICICNYQYTTFDITNSNPLTNIPSCIFQQPQLTHLGLGLLSTSINVSSAVQNLQWNLPALQRLELSPQYVMAGIPGPATGSLLGSVSANLDVSVFGFYATNFIIPDQYFISFANATSFTAPSLQLGGMIPSSVQNLTAMQTFDLSYNALTGAIPPGIYTLPNLTTLNLMNNSLNGFATANMAALLSPSLRQLQLDHNYLDLCSLNVSSAFSPNLSTCTIGGYCDSCSPAWQNCIADCFSTSSAPTAAPSSGCDFAAPSVGIWVCEVSQWVSNTSISSTGPITISSNVDIMGNLTVPTLVLLNASATATVTGCVVNLTSVQVALQDSDISQLLSGSNASRTKMLLRQDGSPGCGPLSDVSVSAIPPAGSCYKVTATTPTTTNPSTLTVVFDIAYDSSCGPSSPRLWWILVPSVVGGVLLLVAVFVLVFWRVKSVRNKVTPFSVRDRTLMGEAAARNN